MTKDMITDLIYIEDFGTRKIVITQEDEEGENHQNIFIPRKNIKDAIAALQAIELKQIFEEKENE